MLRGLNRIFLIALYPLIDDVNLSQTSLVINCATLKTTSFSIEALLDDVLEDTENFILSLALENQTSNDAIIIFGPEATISITDINSKSFQVVINCKGSSFPTL